MARQQQQQPNDERPKQTGELLDFLAEQLAEKFPTREALVNRFEQEAAEVARWEKEQKQGR